MTRKRSVTGTKSTWDTTWWTRAHAFDGWLLYPLLLLLLLGLLGIYSSSAIPAAKKWHHGAYYLHAQLRWLGLGVLLLLVGRSCPLAWVARRAGWWFLLSNSLCALVLWSPWGKSAGGARRWLQLGSLQIQPAEFAKISLVVLLAAILAQFAKAPRGANKPYWLPLVLAQLPIGLILLEPDLGTAVLLEMVVCMLLFVAGWGMRYLLLLTVSLLPVVAYFLLTTPFRWQRLLSFVDPWAFRSTIGYQITEALISIGSGGLWGVGLGHGKQKLFFLPEAHTDFVFAVLAEELGLLGVLLILSCYGLLLGRCGWIASRLAASFEGYLALGVLALFGLQAGLNMAVVSGLLPTKGLPLPFVSYGGSHLLMGLFTMGLLFQLAEKACVQRKSQSLQRCELVAYQPQGEQQEDRVPCAG